jgi:hypothetical protein
MKESFLTQFTNKAEAAHKKNADCFKNQDHIGFLTSYFEEGYYRTLAFAVNGQKQEDYKDENGKQQKVIIDKFLFNFKVEKQGSSRVTQTLKKMGKLEYIPQIEAAIKLFFNDISLDLMVLSDKSTEIYQTLMNMGTSEKTEKGLTNNANNEVCAEDKLFMADKIVMSIITRRKSPGTGYFNVFIKQIQAILQ